MEYYVMDKLVHIGTEWASLNPSRRDFGLLVTELNGSKMVSEERILERGPTIQLHTWSN